MLLAACAVVLAALLHIEAAKIASRENYGRRLPTLYGAYPVRPARRTRKLHAAGWILSIFAAFRIGDALWLTRPWLGIGVVVAILLLVNGLPSLIVTLSHNGKLEAQT